MVLFGDLGFFWKSWKLHLLNLLIRTLHHRLHHLLTRRPFLQSELSVHPQLVLKRWLVINVEIGGLTDSERGELWGIERQEPTPAKSEGVGSVDHHHFVILRVIIGLHVKEYN